MAIRSFSGDREGRPYDKIERIAIPGGIQQGARRPPLAVSNRVGQGRGRIRNLPLPCVASFATFLRTSEEKLTAQLRRREQDNKNGLPPAGTRRVYGWASPFLCAVATPVCALG